MKSAWIRGGALIALWACGSSSSDAGAGNGTDGSGFAADDGTSTNLTALSGSLAQDISISGVAGYQVVKVPLADNGQPADRTVQGLSANNTLSVALVANRDAVVRVFVNPGASFKPKPITARVKVQLEGPAGLQTRVFYKQATVTVASTEADLASTINVEIPGAALQPGASFGVVLNQTGGGAAPATTTARYPQDGSLADMGVVGGGDVVKVKLVPFQYNADGSGRLPATDDGQLKLFRDRFMQLYPTARVELTVRDPLPWSTPIQGSGSGFDVALKAMSDLRGKDNAPSDVYYYGIFSPASSFGAFCGGGCITGLSNLSQPSSCGIGFPGNDSVGTIVHEVGHAHGLDHAPFCGAQAQMGYWPKDTPHDGAHLGEWGYDALNQKMIDPAQATDLMSYCGNNWISDYHYAKLFGRIKGDNKFYADVSGDYRGAAVDGAGAVMWHDTLTHQAWVTTGEPRAVVVEQPDGSHVTETAYWFPYDHLPGGTLMLPAGATSPGLRVRFDSHLLVAPAR